MKIIVLVALIFAIYYKTSIEHFAFQMSDHLVEEEAPYDIEFDEDEQPEDILYRQPEEPIAFNYEGIAYESTLANFKKLEDRQCQYMKKVAPQTWTNYDIMNNFRLLTHPKSKNACYIKMGDRIMENGGCSKSNPSLFKAGDAFNNIVKTVSKVLLIDPYVSKTVPQEACVINFQTKNPKKTNAEEVLTHWDTNDPKMLEIMAQIKALKDNIDSQKVVLESRTRTLEGELKPKHDALLVENAKKKATLNDMKIANENAEGLKKAKVAELANVSNELKEWNKKYQERDGQTARICGDADFNNCKNFPVGAYNLAQIKVQGDFGNDSITGVKVPKGLRVALYEHDNFDGETKMIDGPAEVGFLGDFNDKASSLKVLGMSLA